MRARKPSRNPPDFYAGGTLVPLGGQVAGHKGSGLALVAALLGGLGMIDDPEPSLFGAAILDGSADDRGRISGVFVVVVDPFCFGDAERYQAMVAETLLVMKDVPPAAQPLRSSRPVSGSCETAGCAGGRVFPFRN